MNPLNRKDVIVRTQILFLILAMAMSACGGIDSSNLDSMPTDGGNVLLRSGKNSISLSAVKEDEVIYLHSFTVGENCLYSTDGFSRVVILDVKSGKLDVHDASDGSVVETSIPLTINSKCLFIDENNLFVCGDSETEMLIQYNFNSINWHVLDVPNELTHYGKSIDDIVSDKDYLIVVDNIITPKYILFYIRSSDERLTFSHYKELKSNGPYESIHKGRVSDRFIGTMSETHSGYVGAYQHVSAYDKGDYSKNFSVSRRINFKSSNLLEEFLENVFGIIPNEKNYQWNYAFNDFALVGNHLFIADNDGGLIVCNLCRYTSTYGEKDCEDASAKSISIENYNGERILKLTPIPNTEKLVVTLESGSIFKKIRHEVISF